MTRGGKHFVAMMAAAALDEQKTQSQVIFLQTFGDEVRRRLIRLTDGFGQPLLGRKR